MREKIAGLIHDVNGAVAIRNADVHVQSEDEIGASELLHVLDNFLISLALSNELIAPVRKWVCAHRSNLEAAAAREFCKFGAQLDNMRTRIDYRLANFSAELNDRLVHLRFDLLFEHDFPALENLLDMRAQLA